jgi:L-asparaginase
MPKPSVLIIHTGGTLGMSAPHRARLELDEDAHLERLIERVPELAEIAQIRLIAPYNRDSSDMGPGIWQELARTVVSEGGIGSEGGVDGVVIIHGTDTMSYAASMLAFMLRNLDRPVVLTGSQRPLEAWRTDARANLAAAVECATLDLPEVVIVFGDLILRGCRSSKIDASSYNAFAAPTSGTLGRIGTDLTMSPGALRRSEAPFALVDGFDTRVLAVTLFPGIDTGMIAADVRRAAAAGTLRALVIRGFGVGNVPLGGLSDLRPLLADASGSGLDVIIGSQCYRSHTDLSLYPGGRALVEAGAIAGRDMTFEATITKAMWAMGQPEDSLRGWFGRDLAGEVTINERIVG